MKYRIQRIGLPIAAFLLVGIGTLTLLSNGSSSSTGSERKPTLVAVADIAAGSMAADIRAHVEIRQIAESDRVANALSSLDEIPNGVLAYTHVSGQQILLTSFATNRITAVKKGFVAVSVRLDTQRWLGPISTSGTTVDIYDISPSGSRKISSNAVVVDVPSTTDIGPKDDSVLSLAVDPRTLADVLLAADQGRLWLVGS